MKSKIISAVFSFGLCLGMASAQTGKLNALCPVEVEEGFKLLFDGTAPTFRDKFVNYRQGQTSNTDLSATWTLDAANSAIKSSGTETDIRIKDMVHTTPGFDFRLDYRNAGNQGIIYLFTTEGSSTWSTGTEFAIDNRTDECEVCPGAAYDLFPAKPPTYLANNTNKWNSVRIVNVGDSVEHWMNGVKVVGYKYFNARYKAAYAASKWNVDKEMAYKVKGNEAAGYITDGYIGFQGNHGGPWQLRNLRLKTENVYTGAAKGAHQPGECPTTGVKPEIANASAFPAVSMRTPSGLSVNFGVLVKEAWIMGLDGKSVIKGVVSEAERKADFQGGLKPGVYLLKMRTPVRQLVQKINVL